jgi:hypothetical protein
MQTRYGLRGAFSRCHHKLDVLHVGFEIGFLFVVGLCRFDFQTHHNKKFPFPLALIMKSRPQFVLSPVFFESRIANFHPNTIVGNSNVSKPQKASMHYTGVTTNNVVDVYVPYQIIHLQLLESCLLFLLYCTNDESFTVPYIIK